MDLSDGQTPTYSTAVLKENESTTQKKILFFQKLLSVFSEEELARKRKDGVKTRAFSSFSLFHVR